MSTEPGETNAHARRHQLLAEVAEKSAIRLIEVHGMDAEKACDIGNDLADFLSQNWRGQNIYINSDSQFHLSKRDHEIYMRMERGNAYDLAKEFGISYVRVYQIYKRCLAIARSHTQPGLFEEPAAGEAKLSTGIKGGF